MKKILFLFLLLIATRSLYAQDSASVFICPGDTLRLHAYSPDADHYEWYRNESLLSDTGDILIVVREGTYYARAVGTSGCRSGFSAMTYVEEKIPVAYNDHVTVPPGRSLLIPVLDNDHPGCAPLVDSTVTVTRLPYEGTLMTGPDGKIKYTATTYADGIDSFKYKVSDTNGFISNEATVFVVIDHTCAVLYPNPVDDRLYLKINNVAIARLRLVDASGKVLYQASVTKPVESIDMRSYAAGFYIVEFIDGSGEALCSYKAVKVNK